VHSTNKKKKKKKKKAGGDHSGGSVIHWGKLNLISGSKRRKRETLGQLDGEQQKNPFPSREEKVTDCSKSAWGDAFYIERERGVRLAMGAANSATKKSFSG